MNITSPQTASNTASGNRTGIFAMLVSMASFTANDVGVKLSASTLPTGEIIFLRNAAATLLLLAFAAIYGGLTLPKPRPAALLGWRMFGESISTLFYISALVALPIADAMAIGQFTPLAITAAAALFLGEPVGWRRWLAAGAGLIGVLLILRPGTAAFSLAGGLVVASVVFVVLRDLLTRRLSTAIPTLTLTLMSAASTMAASLILLPFETWRMPTPVECAVLMLAGAFLIGGYAFIIIAMRAGDVGTVSPFRYSAIIFGILAGAMVWNEWPDALSLLGIAIVVGAGLYTFHRERVLQTRPAAGPDAAPLN